jgi:hypothetical protein
MNTYAHNSVIETHNYKKLKNNKFWREERKLHVVCSHYVSCTVTETTLYHSWYKIGTEKSWPWYIVGNVKNMMCPLYNSI